MTGWQRSLMIVVVLTRPAGAIDITQPGQTVPGGHVGVLRTDLVCRPDSDGVLIEGGGALDLNGHVLDGCSVAAPGSSPVRIAVRGPGWIRNAGIRIPAGRLRVRDVSVEDAPFVGIRAPDDERNGPSTIRLHNVTVTGSGLDGIVATKVVARDVTASGNGRIGVGAGIIGLGGVVGRRVTASRNTEGVVAAAGKVALTDSLVIDNALYGVIGLGTVPRALTIVRSTVTRNGVDLLSRRAPQVRDSVCDASLDSEQQVPWGVCLDD